MITDAYISPCGMYRYELTRIWSDVGKLASVIMVNPSTANATDVNELKRAVDPVGPMNASFILCAMLKTDVTVCAWGSLQKLPPQLRNGWRSVVLTARLIDRPLYCWDVCADGQPKHPVMLGYCDPVLWSPPV